MFQGQDRREYVVQLHIAYVMRDVTYNTVNECPRQPSKERIFLFPTPDNSTGGDTNLKDGGYVFYI